MKVGRFARRFRSLWFAVFKLDDISRIALGYVKFVLVPTGIAVLTLLVVLLVFAAPEWVVRGISRSDELSPAEWAENIAQTRQATLLLLGGLIATAGLVYTHRRHQLDRDANRTDRYTSAIEQIGRDSLDVRLGGIFALERIAVDSKRDRPSIAEVLSAFIREHAPFGRVESPGSQDPERATIDVLSAVAVLGRRPYDFARGANLSRSNLFLADLSSTDFRFIAASDAFFDGATLSRSNLFFADFRRSSFVGADLSGAILVNADLRDADLAGADLRRADLSGADLRGADLSQANLSETKLGGAQFDRARMRGTDISRSRDGSFSTDQLREAYNIRPA